MVGSKVVRSLHGSYFERKSDLVSVYFRSEKSDLDGADSEEAKNSFLLFFNRLLKFFISLEPRRLLRKIKIK